MCPSSPKLQVAACSLQPAADHGQLFYDRPIEILSKFPRKPKEEISTPKKATQCFPSAPSLPRFMSINRNWFGLDIKKVDGFSFLFQVSPTWTLANPPLDPRDAAIALRQVESETRVHNVSSQVLEIKSRVSACLDVNKTVRRTPAFAMLRVRMGFLRFSTCRCGVHGLARELNYLHYLPIIGTSRHDPFSLLGRPLSQSSFLPSCESSIIIGHGLGTWSVMETGLMMMVGWR